MKRKKIFVCEKKPETAKKWNQCQLFRKNVSKICFKNCFKTVSRPLLHNNREILCNNLEQTIGKQVTALGLFFALGPSSVFVFTVAIWRKGVRSKNSKQKFEAKLRSKNSEQKLGAKTRDTSDKVSASVSFCPTKRGRIQTVNKLWEDCRSKFSFSSRLHKVIFFSNRYPNKEISGSVDLRDCYVTESHATRPLSSKVLSN